tara:strand:- start:2212 stop:3198 length:987 start_codon:yes stop_codon:yes gene_type:complete
MHKTFLYPIVFVLIALAIPTIAFEEENKITIKYKLNANLDELVLDYCNSYDSYVISKLFSEKDFLKNDNVDILNKNKFVVNIKNKPLNPNIINQIKKNEGLIQLSNFSDVDLNHLSGNKKNFVRTILPIILNENQKILSIRKELLNLKFKLKENKTLDSFDVKNLKKLSKSYNINFDNKHKSEIIDTLLISVDVIPNSIVLAQAAIESGWGSSRFAREYNALFGQYTYDNDAGVVPLKRSYGEKHLIKSFTSYDRSVQSYFRNINSHHAYKDFRKIRKIMRNRNNFSDTNLLVEQLNTYAEDENYIQTIKAVINKNKFNKLDFKTISY